VVKLTAELDDTKLRLESAEAKPVVIEVGTLNSPYVTSRVK
jgi:hypothetical protein